MYGSIVINKMIVPSIPYNPHLSYNCLILTFDTRGKSPSFVTIFLLKQKITKEKTNEKINKDNYHTSIIRRPNAGKTNKKI